MAGNLPVTTTTFESELQSKINTVGSSTSIKDIISYYRAGENIPTINNTALTDEIQLRLNAVSPSTTAEEFLALAASFGKISNTNQDDLQSALLTIADIPTNSELATALSPIATSAELTPLATSNDVSSSEANIIGAINSQGGLTFKPTTLGTSQSYSLSAATSPLVLTPPLGEVIRLDFFGLDSFTTLNITRIYVGNDLIIDGVLRCNAKGNNGFMIGRSSYSDSAGNFAFPTGYKEAITASEPDQTITIETTDATAKNVYYSVSYGDLV